MDYLIYLLNNTMSNPSHTLWVFTGIIGIASAVFVLAISMIATGSSDPLHRRLEKVSGKKIKTNTLAGVTEKMTVALPFTVPKEGEELSKTRSLLMAAGIRNDDAVKMFYGTKMLLALIFSSITLFGLSFVPSLQMPFVFVIIMTALLISFKAPTFYVKRRAKKRQKEIMNGFPDALDLLVTCTEAGLAFTPALEEVANEFSTSHPILAEELLLVNAEIRAGVERTKALDHLVDRTGIDDIQGLVTLINQSVVFGTDIGETLRVYSDEFRDKRMQRAEEQAAKLSTKMIFPLALCLLPAWLVVGIGPAICNALDALSK